MSTEYTDFLSPPVFAQLALKMQQTSESNIVDRSKVVYESHLFGKFGFCTFLQQYNEKYKTNISSIPTEKSTKQELLDWIEFTKQYLQIRCIDGKNDDLDIAMTEKGNPVCHKTAMVVYSAIK